MTDHETQSSEADTLRELTTQQYREKWGLLASYLMVPPNYAARRSILIQKIGLERIVKVTQESSDVSEAEVPIICLSEKKHGRMPKLV